MTIFEAHKSKGDVVQLLPQIMVLSALTPSITSPGTNGSTIEYVAPFLDVTVTVGAEHNACV
jgi:hypothetical protein